MKLSIFILSSLLLTPLMASECHDLEALAGTDYIMLQNLDELNGVEFEDASGPLFSESKMADTEVMPVIGEFDPKECENALTQDNVHFPNGNSLQFIYTIEDNCDGGNSYGYILNQDDKLVGYIGDSDINCK